MTEITDDMCRRAIAAMKPDRIQGFATPQDERRTKWGAPHYIQRRIPAAGAASDLERRQPRGDDGSDRD
jgi:hypothetical protein